ncbi:MAG: restriction endonuclease [Burkholderiales bacterium]
MASRKSNDLNRIALIIGAVLFLAFMIIKFAYRMLYRLFKEFFPEKENPHHRAMLQAVDIAAMEPVAFEHHCAAILKAQGWQCRMTRYSGDFGVDMIAVRSNVHIAFQIKKWTAPVDLKAVQEVVTGIAIYKAHHAAVISVSGYRKSALLLAKANNVQLLHYADLFDFTPPNPSIAAEHPHQKPRQWRS